MYSGETDPFLTHKSEVDVIVAYQSHIAELNKEVVRLRKENTRLIGRAAREPEKPQQVRDEPVPPLPGAAAARVAEGGGRIAHIPIFDVAAAAGLEAFVSDEPVESYLAYPEEWIISVLGSYPQNLVGLRVEGDSMTPQLVDGDVVLVDRMRHETRLLTDGVYVFRYGDELLIKHLREHTGGGIEVISYNSDYKTFIINPTEEEQGEAVIIGTVVWPFLEGV